MQKPEQKILKIIEYSSVPEDYEHALNTLKWVRHLNEKVDYALKIAALGHDIERAIPEKKIMRADYKTYDDFKRAHAQNSATLVEDILKRYDVSSRVIERAVFLIANHELGNNSCRGLQVLKDADSLSFFEINLPHYFKREGEGETLFRMQWGYNRMSHRARQYVKKFCYDEHILREMLQRVIKSS